MNPQIYDNIIKIMPASIIVNTSEVVRDICYAADAEAHNLCAGLVSAIMVEGDSMPAIMEWVKDQLYCSRLLLNSDEGQLFLELDELAHRMKDTFEESKLYIGGIIPYQCEAVMEDGSLLLARVDSFEDFTRLADMRAKEDQDDETASEAEAELPY